MPRPLSNDLRKRVLKTIIEDGMSCNSAAKYYNVSVSFVIRLKHHYLKYNTFKPLKVGGLKKHKLSNFDKLLRDFITTSPDSTLFEICNFLQANGIKISYVSIFRYLNFIGFSLKKRQFMQESNKEKKSFINVANGRNIKKT